jgi:hypothetical protein
MEVFSCALFISVSQASGKRGPHCCPNIPFSFKENATALSPRSRRIIVVKIAVYQYLIFHQFKAIWTIDESQFL